jgi:hypothetical protein
MLTRLIDSLSLGSAPNLTGNPAKDVELLAKNLADTKTAILAFLRSLNQKGVLDISEAVGSFTQLSVSGTTAFSGITTYENAVSASWENSTGTATPVLQKFSDNVVYLDNYDGAIRLRPGTGGAVTAQYEFSPGALGCVRQGANATAQVFAGYKSRHATLGSHTIVQDGDVLSSWSAYGSDGAAFIEGARISAVVSGTPGTNDMPTKLTFSTTLDGNASPTEQMSIAPNGAVAMAGSLGVGGQAVSASTYLVAPASNVAISSMRLPHGTAPSSPTNGDLWTTTAGLFVQINGVTVGPLS